MTGRESGYVPTMTTDQEFTVQSARDAEATEELGDWVAGFLASDGSDNPELGEQLRNDYAIWFGPVQIGFDRLHRLAGPQHQPTLERLDEDDLDTVESMKESIDDGWTPPPFVATWQDDHLMLEDGNHRAEGVRRSGDNRYWCVVGVHSSEERDAARAEIGC